MASKYTKQEVVTLRKCGLATVDAATEKVGRKQVLDESVKLFKQFPNIWGPGWPSFDWAFGNTARELAGCKGEVSMTFNLDEALGPGEMEEVARLCGLNLSEYKDSWPRREKPVQKRVPKPEETLDSAELIQYLHDGLNRVLQDPAHALSQWASAVEERVRQGPYIRERVRRLSKRDFGRISKKRDPADRHWIRQFMTPLPGVRADVHTNPEDTEVLRTELVEEDFQTQTAKVVCQL